MTKTVYKIIKDTSGFYHILYDNKQISFFHTLEDAKKELVKIIKNN